MRRIVAILLVMAVLVTIAVPVLAARHSRGRAQFDGIGWGIRLSRSQRGGHVLSSYQGVKYAGPGGFSPEQDMADSMPGDDL